MSKARAISLGVIAVLAVLGYFLASGNRHSDSPPRPGQATEGVPAHDPSVAATENAPSAAKGTAEALAQPSTPPILKPPEPPGPLQELETTLRNAADRGDARAACTLGIELVRCARLEAVQTELYDTQTALDDVQGNAERAVKDKANVARLSRRIDELTSTLNENQRLCRGVTQELARNSWQYLYAAATAGNVTAMSRFVRDPGFDPLDSETSEAWQTFLASAPDFLARAIAAGDVRALFQGWYSASSGRTIREIQADAFQRDPDKALQYGTAVVKLVDPRRAAEVAQANAAIAKEIGPERAARARQEGERLRTTFFANATPVNWGPDPGETDVNDCAK